MSKMTKKYQKCRRFALWIVVGDLCKCKIADIRHNGEQSRIFFSMTAIARGGDKMPTVINGAERKSESGLSEKLASVLPPDLYAEISSHLYGYGRAEEIRCRIGCHTYITVGGTNLALAHVTDRRDMEEMTDKIFGGSLYAHRETLSEGYVTLDGGIRVGVCGRAVVEDGRVRGVLSMTSLNIRLPAQIYSHPSALEGLLRSGNGVLVYSPPGVGKTTLLRSLAARLASGQKPMRVCVVDTRGELSMCDGALGNADVLVGYPKGVGIEIATRCMSPQLIVCDEIGSCQEAEAIEAAANCGVPLLAAAHGDSIEALTGRSGIERLHRAAVFSYYVGIARQSGRLECHIRAREELPDVY